MAEVLMDLTTRKLLEKFGAGNHKPGSGSASAFQGMLAAQMLKTVIFLSCEDKRREFYGNHVSEFQKIQVKIVDELYPALEILFQLDSQQFDTVIKLRESRDAEADLKKRRDLRLKEKDALLISTKTPLDIADACLELAQFACIVFDKGFRSARGDSDVALNAAVSALANCISIVELNLTTLPFSDQTEEIRERATQITSRYFELSKKTAEHFRVLQQESLATRSFQVGMARFRAGNLSDKVSSTEDLEALVRELQNAIWIHREKIWKNGSINTVLDVLRPDIVLKKVMEYDYFTSTTLGTYEQNAERFEIAGMINKKERLVKVSASFPLETQNFTAAHELGHAILHNQTVLHRDRPVDGSATVVRSREEMQADKFAAFFLMPSAQVEEVFTNYFQTTKFVINVANVLAIRAGSLNKLRQKCKNKRGLAMVLASSDFYGGRSFNPIHKVFQVSVATMAIRLEELNLLEF